MSLRQFYVGDRVVDIHPPFQHGVVVAVNVNGEALVEWDASLCSPWTIELEAQP
ncbi:hypothetical protein SEA_ECLIPTUS_67 [Gordonia phage Ecliptus]|nr:hypothetical protein SEA_ECLIPTUS_67 [Gordonia phage Ecliptus]